MFSVLNMAPPETSPEFSGHLPDAYGRPQLAFKLPKDLTVTLVTGYSVVIRSITRFRILKDRYTGSATGEVIYLGYDRNTGLLYETTPPPDADKPSKGRRGSSFKDETLTEDEAIAF